MDKEEFYAFIKAGIHKYLPEKYQNGRVEFQDVQVSEGVTKPGMFIIVDEIDGTPVINLETYMKAAQMDAVKEDVLEGLAKDYVGLCEEDERLSLIKMTKEEFYGRLHTTIINYDMNQEVLGDVPHKKFYDLAIVPMIAFGEHGSRPVCNKHAEILGISGETILEEAIKNHAKLYPPVLKRVLEEAKGIHILSQDTEPIGNTDSYFELTNEHGMHGAALLADPETLAGIRRILGDDFYMMIDTIHEVTIVTKGFGLRPESLQEAVKKYNESLKKEAVLSNHVFCYSGEAKSLEVYKKKPQKAKKPPIRKDKAR